MHVDFDQNPFVVIWEMTRACDLACVHCRAAAQPRRSQFELTTEEGFRLIDHVRAFAEVPAAKPPLFVLTGATLRPGQFNAVVWIGLAFVAVRLVGKSLALFALAWPAHISLRQASTLALALTPMAGLAIGMTQPIYEVAPEFGARLAAIIASGVAILHLLGPIATRVALIRAGEGEPGARD